jgi:hypothetical protein
VESLRSRTALVIGAVFIAVGILYYALAIPAGYHVEWAGVTLLVCVGVAMGIMFWVLVAGSRGD